MWLKPFTFQGYLKFPTLELNTLRIGIRIDIRTVIVGKSLKGSLYLTWFCIIIYLQNTYIYIFSLWNILYYITS